MAADRINFPHIFFLPGTSPADDALGAAGRCLPHARRLAGQARGGRSEARRHLVANGPRLRVEGTRRDEHCWEGQGCHCMEIAYSQFQRVLELPGLPTGPEMVTPMSTACSWCGSKRGGTIE